MSHCDAFRSLHNQCQKARCYSTAASTNAQRPTLHSRKWVSIPSGAHWQHLLGITSVVFCNRDELELYLWWRLVYQIQYWWGTVGKNKIRNIFMFPAQTLVHGITHISMHSSWVHFSALYVFTEHHRTRVDPRGTGERHWRPLTNRKQRWFWFSTKQQQETSAPIAQPRCLLLSYRGPSSSVPVQKCEAEGSIFCVLQTLHLGWLPKTAAASHLPPATRETPLIKGSVPRKQNDILALQIHTTPCTYF